MKHLHALLAETFIPNPDNLPQVHHKDVNKSNNNLSNLQWVTIMENTQSKNQNRLPELARFRVNSCKTTVKSHSGTP